MKATRQFQKFRQRLLLRNSTRVLLKSGRLKGYPIGVVLTLVVLAGYQVKSQNKSSYQSNTSPSGFDLVHKNAIISKPPDYRDRYQALGVFSVTDLNGAVEMHYT